MRMVLDARFHIDSLWQFITNWQFIPPSSIHLHPAYLSLHLTLCNTFNVIRIKISHVIVQIPQILAEKFKVVRFAWELALMV